MVTASGFFTDLCSDGCHKGAVPTGLFLTTWTPEGFSYYREVVNETFEPADLIRLNPFTTSATETMVDQVMGRIDAPEAFPAETVERIHD